MLDNNEKKIVILLLVTLIIVILIIIFILGKIIFGVNNYEYKLPNDMIKKEVKKSFDDSYIKLTDNEIKEYNEKLSKDDFIISLNNSIKMNLESYNINLLQSDSSKFDYAYSRLKINNKDNIDFNLLQSEIKSIFNYDINDRFYVENSYNSNNELLFCLKANSKKVENNKLYLKLDYVLYDEVVCQKDNLDYEINKYGLLILDNDKDNNKYYIDSFKLIEKEG